jgi:uncharacterized membrane protein YfcA
MHIASSQVKAGMENARLRHVMPFALVLVFGFFVGLLAVARAFLDGEIFDAGSVALLIICYACAGLWILRRARISSPRDRVPLLCGTAILAAGLVLYAWADAEELLEYQTFYESGSDEFEKGLGLAVGGSVPSRGSSGGMRPQLLLGAQRAKLPAAHSIGTLDEDGGVHAYPDSEDVQLEDHGVHAYPGDR